MDKVFVANFGEGNFDWPRCKAENLATTYNIAAAQPFWQAGDVEGYRQTVIAAEHERAGRMVDQATATRWFNLMTELADSADDYWFHRKGDQLWWTKTLPDPPTFSPATPSQIAHLGPVVFCNKPTRPWQCVDSNGRQLDRSALPTAGANLFNQQSTFSGRNDDNAAYARALVTGNDLSRWHNRPTWRKVTRSFTDEEKQLTQTAYRVLDTVKSTVRASLGPGQTTTPKHKDLTMTDSAVVAKVTQLCRDQQGRCALTGLDLLLDGAEGHVQMRASLDRIDSARGYHADNVQLACKFANFWKSAGDDTEFKRLIAVIRNQTGTGQ